jgi:hypothetical protein
MNASKAIPLPKRISVFGSGVPGTKTVPPPDDEDPENPIVPIEV